LRWSDVGIEGAEITFRGSTDVIDGERHEEDTKGGRSRVVSMDSGTVDARRQHVVPDTVSALMGKLVRAAGLPAARLDDLRHLHATTPLLVGVPVHVVAARLGHADSAITLRVYAHVLREQAAGVADVFANAVEAAS